MTRSEGVAANRVELAVQFETILYKQFDVGYEIRLDRAFDLLASSAPERRKPVRGEAHAILIPNPPVIVHLGTERADLGGSPRDFEITVCLYDFGVISLRARIGRPEWLAWDEFVALGSAIAGSGVWGCFGEWRDRLLDRIGPAIVRPNRSAVTEEYTVFRVGGLRGPGGDPVPPSALPDEGVARLLLGERRPVTAPARAHLLSERFSYFEDDLTLLTWSAALVVEPDPKDADVQYVLEFANAQLLELRYYDAILDEELPRTYDEIATARRGFHLLGRRYSRLLAVLQTRVADATEAVERAENALKVTDDVYLARIYAAALEIFRGPSWRRGIDQKVAIVRDAYTMLNAESQARRAEVLELAIVILIVLEIVLAWVVG
ncbi:MAG TPA: hypothetical protein VFP58_01700 [Candidatus Eisenbacteria bacterium]|nr:hypothetical protein [Candidatus Eisenbacteria bacterium]